MCVAAVVVIITTFFKNRKSIQLHGGIKTLMTIYLFLDFVCVILQSYVRGESLWGGQILNFMTYHFVANGYYLAFVMPFVVCTDLRKFDLSFLCKYGGYVALIFVIYFFTSYESIIAAGLGIGDGDETGINGEMFPLIFSTCSFLLLLTPYIKDKRKLVAIFLLGMITLFTTVIFARRGSSLSVVLVLLSSLYLYLRKVSVGKKVLAMAMIVIMAFIGYSKLSNSYLLDNIKEKGMYDSRSEVDDYFKKDMFNSSDVFFGRGMNGKYYCPQTYSTEDGPISVSYRTSIETGFYHLVLKGGIFFALLHVLILFVSAFRGLFFSRNNILKAFSLWILLSLWELYPFGWPTFSIKFFLIWIGVCLCNSKFFLNMNDRDICHQLKIE